MDQAKAAVSNFMSKAGHKDTTVHESVAPAVTNETVKEQQREERQVVKDREIHQDHHHTSIQPVHDKEVLAETHHHNLVGTEHRTQDNRDHSHTKEHLQHEAGQFQNTSTRVNAQSAQTSNAGEVAGEHVHHHVHERIQPVIHKETIEPHVVHTTVPVHETIHNKAQHHTASTLPAVNLSDFKAQGGSLTGRDTRTDHFSGEPHTIDKVGHNRHHNPDTSSGEHSGALGHGVSGTSHTGTHTTGTHTGSHTGALGSTGTTGTTGTSHHIDSTHSSQKTKPSLMDKLNPKKDADGDGKAGFMS